MDKRTKTGIAIMAAAAVVVIAVSGPAYRGIQQAKLNALAGGEEITYATGQWNGFGGGMVTADVILAGGDRIIGLELTGEGETEGMGIEAMKVLTVEILDKQTIEGVDGYSGCTITTNGIFNAIRVAMGQEPVVEEAATASVDLSDIPVGSDGLTYVGEGQGFGGTVTAMLGLDGDTVVAISLTGSSETPDIGGAALPVLEEAILTAGGLDGVEGVSGATFTSNGVFEAVNAALAAEGVAPETLGGGASLEGVVGTGEGQGFGGTITAQVAVDGDTITGIILTGPGETPEIGGAALPVLEEAILAAGSLDGVEGVSGATFTSNGVFDAVKAALTATEGAEPAAEEQVEEEEAFTGEGEPGTGEGTGFGGTITAELTFDGEKITSLKLTGEGETPAIGGAALPVLKEAILEKGGLDGVEAVSGATFTSNGVFEAVEAALLAAGGSSEIEGAVTGEGTGYGGPVVATLTVDGETITSLTLTGEGETRAIGGQALPVLEEAILAAGSLDGVEGVSGATFTSNGVFEAVEAALAAAAETEEQEKAAPAGETVTGEGQGFGGTITAEVTLDGETITALTLTGENETPAVGGAALPVLEEAIVAAGSLDGVEGVSGATLTSNGVFEAVEAALAAAAETEEQEEAAPAGETVTGEGQGFGGTITAEVTLDGETITALTLTGEDETPAVGGAALPVLEEAIVAAGSLDGVEGVSGATLTSNGVFEAVENALK